MFSSPSPYIICHAQVRVCSRQEPAHTGLRLFLLKKAIDFVSGSGNRRPSALHKHRRAGRSTSKAFHSGAGTPQTHTETSVRPELLSQGWGGEEGNVAFSGVARNKYPKQASSFV